MEPKYLDITVHLTGRDGNAFHVIGLVTKAMKDAGVDQAEMDEFKRQATSGDYTGCYAPSSLGFTSSKASSILAARGRFLAGPFLRRAGVAFALETVVIGFPQPKGE